MPKTALIIVDVQEYFINKHTRHIPALITKHLSQSNYDLHVFTRFVNRVDSNFVRILEWDRCFEAPDTELVNEFASFINTSKVLPRSTYSAMTSELQQILHINQIEKVFICGIDSDACVIATAFDLFDLGYNFEIIEELCASTEGEEIHRAALKLFQRNLKRQKKITA